MSLGFLSKYLFIYLILAIKIIFIIKVFKKKSFNIKLLIPGLIFIIFISPHIFWLINNNYVTLSYALSRTGVNEISVLSHFYNPLIFLVKQIGIFLPVIIMISFLIKFKKINLNAFKKTVTFYY